jgi:hypothetical protein
MAASFLLIGGISFAARGQSRANQNLSPNALVADLYRQHNLKRSPFFQTRSRARVDRYFTRRLADLIWKDARASKGEVGALDGDPLYNAQDMKIKRFSIGSPKYSNGGAEVRVSFENFGKKNELVFQLVKDRNGWRIDDIKYDDGTTLTGILGGARPPPTSKPLVVQSFSALS